MNSPDQYRSSLSTKLLRLFRDPSFIEVLQGRNPSSYEYRVWVAADRVDRCITELSHLLGRFPKITNTTQASEAIKTYIVSWRSLSDVIACLINHAFDLGLHERDVNLGLVLRNTHVRGYGIQALIQSYDQRLNREQLTKLRNQVIHQGFLDDPELETMERVIREHQLRRILSIPVPKHETQTAKRQFASFLEKRKKEYETHLVATVELVEKIVLTLGKIVEDRSKNRKSQQLSGEVRWSST